MTYTIVIGIFYFRHSFFGGLSRRKDNLWALKARLLILLFVVSSPLYCTTLCNQGPAVYWWPPRISICGLHVSVSFGLSIRRQNHAGEKGEDFSLLHVSERTRKARDHVKSRLMLDLSDFWLG